MNKMSNFINLNIIKELNCFLIKINLNKKCIRYRKMKIELYGYGM